MEEEKEQKEQLELKSTDIQTKEQAAKYWNLLVNTNWYDIYGSSSIFLK